MSPRRLASWISATVGAKANAWRASSASSCATAASIAASVCAGQQVAIDVGEADLARAGAVGDDAPCRALRPLPRPHRAAGQVDAREHVGGGVGRAPDQRVEAVEAQHLYPRRRAVEQGGNVGRADGQLDRHPGSMAANG